MEKKYRVCECFAGFDFIYGGVEEFIMNMLQQFSNPQIEYCVFIPKKIENEKLYFVSNEKKITVISEFIKSKYKLKILRRIQYIKQFRKFFKSNHFDIVHLHCCNCVNTAFMTMMAKKCGAKTVIVHSHIAGAINLNLKEKIEAKICKHICLKYADQYIACSDLAAQWMFPKKIVKEHKYQVVKNAIDVKKFTFDLIIRQDYRKQFGITDELVLCNVGRFAIQKNHEFMIEIAKLLSEKQINYKFILVGYGPLKNNIVKKIKELNLSDKFIFLEKRDDIPQIMMASDLFVMPSWYEGLPVTLIEAQATGLQVLASDKITNEVGITDLVQFLPITNPQIWVDKISKYYETTTKRKEYADEVAKAGYSAEDSAKLLEKIYLECCNK